MRRRPVVESPTPFSQPRLVDASHQPQAEQTFGDNFAASICYSFIDPQYEEPTLWPIPPRMVKRQYGMPSTGE